MRVLRAQVGKHGRPRRTASAPPRLITVTDRRGTAHLVTDAAMVTARLAEGRYAAVCGAVVLPASLTAPVDRTCRTCAVWVFAWKRGLLRLALG